MLKEFRAFLIRGNVIDLAVGVIAGIVFGAVVKSLVDDVIMQLVAVVFGKPDFSSLQFTLNGAHVRYGQFLTAVLNFVLTMGGVFFLIVKPLNAITAKIEPLVRDDDDGVATQRECPECLTEIPAAAKRCKACTAVVVPAT
ncbi:MAG: mscL [Thermoleophilia bacterium]|nr:mscL [Thermoleophilia bacterium]